MYYKEKFTKWKWGFKFLGKSIQNILFNAKGTFKVCMFLSQVIK